MKTSALLRAALCAGLLAVAAPAAAIAATYSGAYVSNHDGDTITVRIDGKKERIRLIGIDAPEPDEDARVLAHGQARVAVRACLGGQRPRTEPMTLGRTSASKNAANPSAVAASSSR